MNISQNLPQFCTQTASMLCRCNLDELCLVILIIPLIQISSNLFLLYGSKIGLQMRAGASPDFCESFTEEQKLSRARHYSENDKNNQKKLIKRFKACSCRYRLAALTTLTPYHQPQPLAGNASQLTAKYLSK